MLSIQHAGGRHNITIFHLDIYGHTLKEHRKSDGHQLDAWTDGRTDGHPGEHDYVGLAQARPNKIHDTACFITWLTQTSSQQLQQRHHNQNKAAPLDSIVRQKVDCLQLSNNFRR